MNNDDDDLIKELECPICFQTLNRPVTTTCGHTFCLICITNSIKSVPKCPTCRFPILNPSFKENTLIKNLIATKFKSQLVQQEEKIIQNNLQDVKKELIPQSLLIFTNQFVIPYSIQKVTIVADYLLPIPEEQLISFLQGAEIVLIKPFRNFQQNLVKVQEELIGVRVKVKGIQVLKKTIQLDFHSLDRIAIEKLSVNDFKIQIPNSDNAHEENKQSEAQEQQQNNKQLEFQMVLCNGHAVSDDPIDLKDIDTRDQIQILLKNICGFLKKQIEKVQQDPQLSQSQMAILLSLQQMGFLIELSLYFSKVFSAIWNLTQFRQQSNSKNFHQLFLDYQNYHKKLNSIQFKKPILLKD